MRRRTTLLGLALASAMSIALVGFNCPTCAAELNSGDEVVEDTYVDAVSADSDDELIVIDSGILTADRYAPE
ncbi:hypothetical protein QYZ88_012830 [Lachnospiraceae bacterium C1.1]|nr:hypothetical protein [Lachnospiraceae bacterium C1.1]